jgi:Ca-activated chloride channel family protein
MHAILNDLETTRFVAPTKSTKEFFPLFLAPVMALVALEALARLVLVRRFP